MKHKKLKTAIQSVLISVVIYLILSFLVVMILYEGMFARNEKYEYRVLLSYEDMGDYPCREVSFDSGGFTLSGRVYNEDGQAGTVILGHAKDGSGEDLLAEAQYFADSGFAAMVFDLTGHGDSTGTAQRGLCQAAADMKSAVLFCGNDEHLSGKPIFLFGFGVSGYGAALCASMEQVTAVTTVSAFVSVPEMTLEYARSKMGILGYLEYPVMLLYQYLIFGDALWLDAAEAIGAADTPVLAIHGTKDDTVSLEGASLYARRNQVFPHIAATAVEGGRHGSVLRSEDAVAYLDAFNEEALRLSQQYGGNVPVSLIEELYERYDRAKMSELDGHLMETICEFYRVAGENG